MRRESRAMRNVNRCDWWSFPTVNVVEAVPKNCCASKKKKKVGEMEIKNSESVPRPNAGLLLKLNYNHALHACSDKDSPFSASTASKSSGNDVRARVAHIDLFPDNEGVREASVHRYKEKRRTRLSPKKSGTRSVKSMQTGALE